jgi:KaiC/GvpD/RAD55 family RecA-like ATPase
MSVGGAVRRVPTYVTGLDARMGGGIPAGAVVLIEGGAGCLKSTLAYSILYQNAIRHQFHGLYITLEQSRHDLEEHMEGLGMSRSVQPDLESKVAIVDLGELRGFLSESGESEAGTDWLKSILKQIESYREEFPLDVFVLDSLNALLSLHDKENPRVELFHFLRELKSHPMTSFLIYEGSGVEGWGKGSVDFLSDGIIRMEAKRVDEVINMQLGVVKMRKTPHDRSFLPLIVRKGSLEVVGK